MEMLQATTTPAGRMSTRRRALAWRGLLLLAFGVCELALILLAFRLPHVTVSTLVFVMSAFLLLDAGAVVRAAVQAPERWPWRAAQALTSLTAGLLVPLFPGGTPLAIFTGWAIVSGVLDAAEERASGFSRPVLAVLPLALALVVFAGPVRDVVLLLLAVSTYGMLAGALRLRRPGSGRR